MCYVLKDIFAFFLLNFCTQVDIILSVDLLEKMLPQAAPLRCKGRLLARLRAAKSKRVVMLRAIAQHRLVVYKLSMRERRSAI